MLTTFLMSACSPTPKPTYDAVRSDALDAMQTVADAIPDPKAIHPRPEQPPYSCDNELMGMRHSGAFFTGYWEVAVADDMDVTAFVSGLLDTLGDGWRTEPQAVGVPYAQTNLLRDSSGVSVTVEERPRNGSKGIDILAISRCGIQDEPASAPTAPHSARTNSPTASASPAPISSAGRLLPFTSNE